MPLASNQIQYSLLYRVPESNGVIEACNEAGATVIAYSPLAQGLLTGALTCTYDRILQNQTEVHYQLLASPQFSQVLSLMNALGQPLSVWGVTNTPSRPGKYNKDNLPGGQRSFQINAERVEQIEPLIRVMREVGAAHGGKTPGQV